MMYRNNKNGLELHIFGEFFACHEQDIASYLWPIAIQIQGPKDALISL